MLSPNQLDEMAKTCRNLALSSATDQNRRELMTLAEQYERRARAKRKWLAKEGFDPESAEAMERLQNPSFKIDLE